MAERIKGGGQIEICNQNSSLWLVEVFQYIVENQYIGHVGSMGFLVGGLHALVERVDREMVWDLPVDDPFNDFYFKTQGSIRVGYLTVLARGLANQQITNGNHFYDEGKILDSSDRFTFLVIIRDIS